MASWASVCDASASWAARRSFSARMATKSAACGGRDGGGIGSGVWRSGGANEAACSVRLQSPRPPSPRAPPPDRHAMTHLDLCDAFVLGGVLQEGVWGGLVGVDGGPEAGSRVWHAPSNTRAPAPHEGAPASLGPRTRDRRCVGHVPGGAAFPSEGRGGVTRRHAPNCPRARPCPSSLSPPPPNPLPPLPTRLP